MRNNFIPKFLKTKSFYSVTLSVVLSVVFVAVAASAATTIDTNINTSGSLTVSGVSQINGSLQATSTLLATGATTLYATTTLSGEAPFILGQSSTDLTGQAEGTLFYDSSSKLLRLYDGSAWFSVATTTGGFTISGVRAQLSDNNTEYLAIGTSTLPDTAGSVLTILQATSTVSIPLGIFTTKGGGQTSPALSVYDDVQATMFSVSATGNVSTNGGVYATGTMMVDGDLYAGGGATTTSASGNIATEGTLSVGPSQNRTAIARLVAGVCYLDIVAVTASSTAYAVCTTPTGVTNGDKVFVSATSSLSTALIIQAASSTPVASEISVRLYNTGYAAGTASSTAETSNSAGTGVSLNFWAFR